MRQKKWSALYVLGYMALTGILAVPARAQLFELPARATKIDDISGCESEACFEPYRNTKYPIAIAVVAKGLALKETSLQARRTGSGKPFETVARNTAEISSGGVILWHLRHSLLSLGPQVDVRVRVVSKTKGAKNCPALKLHSIEGPPWVEYYDSSTSAWTEANIESVTAIRIALPLPLRSEIVCK